MPDVLDRTAERLAAEGSADEPLPQTMDWTRDPARPKPAVTRRDLMRTGIAAGFALAVQPIAEGTIITDTKGIVAGMVEYKGPDGVTIPAYRAYPAKGKTFPTVLVVQEIFGLHEHIKDLCRRLAKAGYYALAPELYVRQGEPKTEQSIQDIIEKIVSKVTDAQVQGDLDAAVAYAKTDSHANTDRLAITGFCWGGRQTWLYAIHNPKVKAAAAWYGPLGAAAGSQPSVIDLAPTLTVPVLGQYGGKDQGIPQTDIEKMRTTLAAGKSGSEIVVYPDAGHGFNADYRPSYNEKDAKAGWARMLAWFKKHGV